MTTKELIKYLNDLDPSGNKAVMVADSDTGRYYPIETVVVNCDASPVNLDIIY